MEGSKISWCDHTFNPWIGCTKVSAGCTHCYAERLMDARLGRVKWGPRGTRVRTSTKYWNDPLRWNKQQWHECEACGWRGELADDDGCPGCNATNALVPTRQRVFCASLADVFERKNDQPEMDAWREELFRLIINTPNLDWLLLTKRPENVCPMIEQATGFSDALMWFPDNVWMGVSAENQEQADKRIPILLRIPAAVRFVSEEPLVGPVDMSKWINDIDWHLVGGESGPDARPINPNWVRDLRDQCARAGVAFHFKQWGEWMPREWGDTIRMPTPDGRSMIGYWQGDKFIQGGSHSDTQNMARVGKNNAGCVLDGRTWRAFPVIEKD